MLAAPDQARNRLYTMCSNVVARDNLDAGIPWERFGGF